MKTYLIILLLCVLFASCATEKPQPIRFEDRPSSLAPSTYRGTVSSSNRQQVVSSDTFLAENQSALNRGIDSLVAASEAKRRAREAAWASAPEVSSGSGSSRSSSSERLYSGGNYEDCTCTYDALKWTSPESGNNTIKIRSSRGNWTVHYYFSGGTGYLTRGGNLEGKTINVRFDGGRPASLKTTFGTGYCKVTSASRD